MSMTRKGLRASEDCNPMSLSIEEKSCSSPSLVSAESAADRFGCPVVRIRLWPTPQARHNCLHETLDWNKIDCPDFLRIAREVSVEDLFECIVTDKMYSKTGERPWDLSEFVLQRKDRRLFIGGQGVVMFVRRQGHSTSLAMKVCYHRREEKKVERHVQRTILHLKGQSASQFVGTILVNYLTRRFFITIMPKAKFASLKTLKQELGTLPESSIRYYFACITSALVKLHSIQICHRDIKCDNVLIMHNGTPALIDFGLAVKAPATMAEYKPNARVTQMQYYPPETRQMGNFVNDYKIDSWLLGFFMCEMLLSDREHLWAKFRGSNQSNWIFATCPACRMPNIANVHPVLNQLLIRDPKARCYVADIVQQDYLKEGDFFDSIEQAEPPPLQTGTINTSTSLAQTERNASEA
ncbi:hypothetical protein BOX15_Mlig019684g1 [Macrostomum lignano]|uniref:non-specific serine/threonine protein kinase n=1 Tax=Macrostomum lignano TaxID=282301 RepID=A0A267GTC1_9PLAT|nr:hypothetical protein BOX15_Mlig019684g2 [Macrostomum lignano]PAA89255.1 hypothetical protein BOX15_Mlig019684g1 [Macrostomum lignano]